MSTEIATVYFSLVPSTKGIGSGIENAVVGPSNAAGLKAGKGIGSGIEKGSKAGILSAKNALTGLGVVGAVAAVKSVQGFQNAAKEVMQLKRQVGGTTEEMSRLRFVAQQSGLSTQTVARAFVLLSKNGAAGKLDQFGVSLKNADGSAKPLTAQLGILADKYVSMGSAQERNRLLMAAFGRGGAEMGKLLQRGSQGISDLEKEADKLGVTLTDKNLDAIAKNLAATRKFSASVQGLEIQLGQGLIPALTATAGAGTKFVTAFTHQPALLRDIELGSLAAAVGYSKLLKPLIGLAGQADLALKGIGPIGGTQGAADAGVAAASSAAAAAKQASVAASAELVAAENAAAAAGQELATVMVDETATSAQLTSATLGLEAAMANVAVAKENDAIASQQAATAAGELAAAEGVAATAAEGLSFSLGLVATAAGAVAGGIALGIETTNRSQAAGTKWAQSLVAGMTPLQAFITLQKQAIETGKDLGKQRGGIGGLDQFKGLSVVTKTALQGIAEGLNSQAAAIVAQSTAIGTNNAAMKGWGGTTLETAAAQAALAANTKSTTQVLLDRLQAQSQLVGSTSAARDAIQAYADAEATAAGRGKQIDDLRHQAAQTAQQDAAAIKSAEDGVAQAIETRNNAVTAAAAAHAAVVADGKTDVQLVKDMAKAIDEAKASIVSLKRSASRDKIGVKEAKIAMDEAIAAAKAGPVITNANAPIDPYAQQKLDDAAALAKLDYADAVDRATASEQASNQATADGVSKSPQVLAVQAQIAANAEKTQKDREAEAAAIRDVAKANDAIGTAAAAAAAAVGKSRDDQVTAYGEIKTAEDDAKKKADDLKTAASDAALAWASSAASAGLPVAAILTGLKTLADSALPSVKAQIDAIITDLINSAPLVAGAAVVGATGSATPAATSSGSSWTNLAADLGKSSKGPKGKGKSGPFTKGGSPADGKPGYAAMENLGPLHPNKGPTPEPVPYGYHGSLDGSLNADGSPANRIIASATSSIKAQLAEAVKPLAKSGAKSAHFSGPVTINTAARDPRDIMDDIGRKALMLLPAGR